MESYFDLVEKEEREKIIMMLKKDNGTSLGKLPAKWQDDEEVVATAMMINKNAFYSASSRLKNDKEFILRMIPKVSCMNFDALSNRLKEDKEIVLSFLLNGMFPIFGFARLPSTLRNDMDIVNLSIEMERFSLKFATEEIKGDKDLVKKIMKYNPLEFNNASFDLRNQMEMVLYCLRLDEGVLCECRETGILFGYYWVSKVINVSKIIIDEFMYVNSIYNCKSMNELCSYFERTEELRQKAKKYIFVDMGFRFV
jgi:hypothetical protein